MCDISILSTLLNFAGYDVLYLRFVGKTRKGDGWKVSGGAWGTSLLGNSIIGFS